MISETELRRNWRADWLGTIQEFADSATQRRLWLDPTNTNPHFSFIEYMCCYLDAPVLSERGYAGVLNDNLVSAEEIVAVRDFHSLAQNYESPTDDYDHEAILADPNWAEVVFAAKRAQAALLGMLSDQHERHLLTAPSPFSA